MIKTSTRELDPICTIRDPHDNSFATGVLLACGQDQPTQDACDNSFGNKRNERVENPVRTVNIISK